jgi:hypothetical protein
VEDAPAPVADVPATPDVTSVVVPEETVDADAVAAVPTVDGKIAGVLTQWDGTNFVPVVKINVPE